MRFEIQTRYLDPGVALIPLSGELDLYNCPELRKTVRTLLERGIIHLVIALDEVEYLDSTGLGTLLSALRRTHEHFGSLKLLCTRNRLLRLLKITRLDQVFEVYDTEAEALRGALAAMAA